METDHLVWRGADHLCLLYRSVWFIGISGRAEDEGNRDPEGIRSVGQERGGYFIGRLFEAGGNSVAGGGAVVPDGSRQMAGEISISGQLELVDVCGGRGFGGVDCTRDGEFSGDQGRHGEPGKEFEDGVDREKIDCERNRLWKE